MLQTHVNTIRLGSLEWMLQSFPLHTSRDSFRAMEDDSEDWLMDLLTYSDPCTGRKRVAGQSDLDDSQKHKRTRFLVKKNILNK